ncbi:MAG: hypothetical protein WCQ95_03680 [Bacteroidota bacterium]
MKQYIKDFEGWRAEQHALVFLTNFKELVVKQSQFSSIDFLIGIKYDNQDFENVFGVVTFPGKKNSWFAKKMKEEAKIFSKFDFPLLLFVFDMDNNTGSFSWINKPIGHPVVFNDIFKFYSLTDSSMGGLIGVIQQWYFEKTNLNYLTRLNEIWKNIDNTDLKKTDRIYFSCSEEWEKDYLIDKIRHNYPIYSKESIISAIKSCCKSKDAPFERMAFENCVINKLRFKI